MEAKLVEELWSLLLGPVYHDELSAIRLLVFLAYIKNHLYEEIKNMYGHCLLENKGTCCRLWVELHS